MNPRVLPMVGHWYQPREKGGLFQVVALDEELGIIDIQEFDGDVDEIDLDGWRQMAPEEAAPPDDWSGPGDDVEPDGLGYTDLEAAALASTPEPSLTWEEMLGEDDEEPDVAPGHRDAAEARQRRAH